MSELIRDMKRTKRGLIALGERKMHWLDTPPSGGGVYVLEFVREDEVIGRYVGSTHDFEKRRYQHFTRLCSGKHERRQMQRFFDENRCWVRFRVLENPVEPGMLLEREAWWIKHLGAEFNKTIPQAMENDVGWQLEREPEVDDSWESVYDASIHEPELDRELGPWLYDRFSPEELYQGTYIYQD